MRFNTINKLNIKSYLLCFVYILITKITLSRKIILIQNAESDQNSNTSLSITGEARSICLNELIENNEELKPQIIYAQNPNGDLYTPLPYQTVSYIASKQNIKIVDSFKERQQAKLASTIENLSDEINTILLCWNRYQIELLVRTLGIDEPPIWNDGYDNLWIVENNTLNDTTQNLGSCIEKVKVDLYSGITEKKNSIHIYLLSILAIFFLL
ncbi:hypothetical protein BCR36DRAFT_343792 [Piromyces finnis]|uniref:Uncharacterized protein n=1 Tax=Piromyces finnis TaxID=1754191 RepID=A0A1Y1VK76_9FUNG|nr:hypothetical protein BCR36DRAFT_343792 [Piromyces finnis]|eukprot:ORX58494.1 hypothetical protein BCR36DRAFT_343792 [Piromyces finnis]